MTRRSKEDVLAALEENLPKPVKVVKEIVLKTADSDQIVDAAETDVQYSRDKLKELIDLSSEAIQNMMALASETEHPRAFEVLSTMIKQTGELSQDLVKLQKLRKEIVIKNDQEQGGSQTTNNSIFVGSTEELQKFLKEKKSE